MRYIILMCAVFSLQGCIGTEIMEPDANTQETYPKLSSVPPRPQEKDFTQLRKEWQELQQTQDKPKTAR